jgi:hypothetical protein
MGWRIHSWRNFLRQRSTQIDLGREVVGGQHRRLAEMKDRLIKVADLVRFQTLFNSLLSSIYWGEGWRPPPPPPFCPEAGTQVAAKIARPTTATLKARPKFCVLNLEHLDLSNWIRFKQSGLRAGRRPFVCV